MVFHTLPDEIRDILIHKEQAVIAPSRSIHCGAGTASYTFIWGMVGENQTSTIWTTFAWPIYVEQ